MKEFYSINEFKFLFIFKENIKHIIKEYKDIDKIKNLPKYRYDKNTDNIAEFNETSGIKDFWQTLPIYCGANKNIENNTNKIFPKTIGLIKQLQKQDIIINSAQFCKLNGYSYFPRHKHEKQNFVIFHIILFNLDNKCVYESENVYRNLKDVGDYVIFPLTNMHSVYNFSKKSKISFSISFLIS